MPQWNIDVTRLYVFSGSIVIEADTEDDAKEIAKQQAGDISMKMGDAYGEPEIVSATPTN